MAERPRVTVSEAVAQFDVSPATLKRRLASNEIPGAEKNGRGQWQIPIESLQTAGIPARKTWLSEPPVSALTPLTDPLTPLSERAQPAHKSPGSAERRATELERELAQVAAQLAHERAQRERAEAIADERKERITDLQRALAMIEAAPSTAPLAPPAPSRRRWWQRDR